MKLRPRGRKMFNTVGQTKWR